jgi:6-phosphogluconolactonase
MVSTHIAYVGTRTTPERGGTGTGIHSFVVDDGRWTPAAVTPAVNPGFLAIDSQRGILHAAHGDQDYLTTYRMHDNGVLEELGRQATEGTNPAHLCLDPSNRFVLVANHTSGSVVSLPVLSDGSLGPVTGKVQFTGAPGPHRTDQPGSKPHQVVFSPSGDYFAVPDKGLDTVFTCRLDPDSGDLEICTATRLREFSGPRHIAFHPQLPVAYSINELNSTLTVLNCQNPANGLESVQVLSTLADTDVRDSRGAEVALSADGRTLYASNRSGAGDTTPGGPGEDTIAVYRVMNDGMLRLLTVNHSGGNRPRFIGLDLSGTRLYATNEKSDSIHSLTVGKADGTLGVATEVAQVGSPVCVAFTACPSR